MKTDERLDFAKGKGSLCFSRESVERMLKKKEKEMMVFAAWLVSEKGKDLDCNFIYYRNPTEAYLYWKKEVKTK